MILLLLLLLFYYYCYYFEYFFYSLSPAKEKSIWFSNTKVSDINKMKSVKCKWWFKISLMKMRVFHIFCKCIFLPDLCWVLPQRSFNSVVVPLSYHLPWPTDKMFIHFIQSLYAINHLHLRKHNLVDIFGEI